MCEVAYIVIRSFFLLLFGKENYKTKKKKFKNPDCYKTFASKRGFLQIINTASAASRLVFSFLLLFFFYAHAFFVVLRVFISLSLHTASTARFGLVWFLIDHTHKQWDPFFMERASACYC